MKLIFPEHFDRKWNMLANVHNKVFKNLEIVAAKKHYLHIVAFYNYSFYQDHFYLFYLSLDKNDAPSMECKYANSSKSFHLYHTITFKTNSRDEHSS